MPPTDPNDHTLSPEEFLKNLRSLSDTDKNRLMLFAANRCLACRFEAEDLLSEAITRTIEGIRHCPSGLNIVTYLYETMRSIVSSELKSIKRLETFSLTVDDANSNSHQLDIPDKNPSPEQQVISETTAKKIISEVFSMFKDDDIAQFILECWIEDMDPEDIRDTTGLSPTEYNSKLKKIRRRLNKSYPRGFVHEQR
jgi:RNA polymerase sigma factor (sigma-70 family)